MTVAEVAILALAGNIALTAQWSVCNHSRSNQKASCKDAVKCSVCKGFIGIAEHTPSEEYKSDGSSHWHECTVCGEKLDQAEHTGGTATCKEKAECEICHTKYGELAPHKIKTEWSVNGEKHWHECTVCGYKKDAVTIDPIPDTTTTTTPPATTTTGGSVQPPEGGSNKTAIVISLLVILILIFIVIIIIIIKRKKDKDKQ